jgi:hypothetical protein
MAESGTLAPDLLSAAELEADLLAHPYVGVEHVALAALWLAGDTARYQALHAQVNGRLPQRPWRPRGPRSALRRAGRAATLAAQEAALRTRSATRRDD